MTTVDPHPAPAASVPQRWSTAHPEPVTSGPVLVNAVMTDVVAPRLLAVPVSAKRSMRRTVRAYVALTKPRIIELLLVTTLPTMVLAQGGLPGVALMVQTLLGGTLAAASANALNCYLDRDIDVLMNRTSGRPLVTGDVTPRAALLFGLGLGVLSIVWLAVMVNPVSAALTLAAILLYVVGYTMILKRRTPENIVWGGAAGCMPVLIGWSAVTGGLTWAPVVLFGIIFLWTPPHYWPLSMRYRDDYAAAGVPMLSVVVDATTVANRVVRYTWAMVLWSLLLWPVAGTGPLYPVAAAALGGLFLREAYALRTRSRGDVAAIAPMRTFHWSITYLTLLFVVIAIDPLLF